MNEDLNRELGKAMARSQDGDAGAYRSLLEKLNELASSYARRFDRRTGGGDSDWEDAVQEILLAVHDKRRTYDPAQAFLPWFYAIARYKMIDRYRARRRMWQRLPRVENFDVDLLPAEEQEIVALAQSDLDKILAELPEKQRQVLRLVKVEGFSIAEAAQSLGLSASDVKVSIHRGMKSLTEGRTR